MISRILRYRFHYDTPVIRCHYHAVVYILVARASFPCSLTLSIGFAWMIRRLIPPGFQHQLHPKIMSNQEIVHAYRHLLRWSLRAVQFSKPARFVVRDTLRAAFRDKNGTFEPSRIKSTLWFLESAATYVGVEHKIIKNLAHVRWIQRRQIGPWRVRAQLLHKYQQ